MTTAQDCFIDALTAKVEADSRVRAAWLGGSFGKEMADRWSDVDAHLLIDDSALDEFRGEVDSWLGQIRPLVFIRLMFDGRMVNAMTDEAMRLDVWLHSGKHAEVTEGETRVLYEEKRSLVWQPSPGSALSREGAEEILRREIPEFWRCVAMLPVVVGRNEKLVAAAGNSIILLHLTNVLCAASGRRKDRGVKALNSFLLPDHRRRVEEAASLTNLPLGEAARFPLRLARIMRDCGPAICEQWDVGYPRAMEESVLHYVTQELRTLGFAYMLEELD